MKKVFKDAFIEVDGVNFSNYCSSVTVETKFDEVDVTGFGSTYKEILQGLGDATITLEVWQDFSAAAVDDTLWPLSQSGEAVLVKVRADDGSVSSTNPSYQMTASVFGYNPIAGKVGDGLSTSVPLRNASSAGLTRHTT